MLWTWLLACAPAPMAPVAAPSPPVSCDEVDSGPVDAIPDPGVPWDAVVHAAVDEGLWLSWADPDEPVLWAARAGCAGHETSYVVPAPEPLDDTLDPLQIVSAGPDGIRLLGLVEVDEGVRVDWYVVPHPTRGGHAHVVSHTVAGTPALLAGHPDFGALLRETRGKTVTVWQLDESGEALTALAEHEPGFHLTGHLGADGTAWWVADDNLYRDGELHGPIPRGGDWTVGSLDDQLWLAYLDGGDLVLADSSGQASRTIGLSLASSAVGVVVGPRLSWVIFDGFATREPTDDDLPETRVAAIGPYGQVSLPTVVRRADRDSRPGMAATRLEDGRLLAVFADGGVRVFEP